MAQILNTTITMPVDEVKSFIINQMSASGLSVTCEHSSTQTINNHHIHFLIFEKYLIRVKNRLSLSILITGDEKETSIEAVSSGGGTGSVFKMTWGAEGDLIYSLEKIIKKMTIE